MKASLVDGKASLLKRVSELQDAMADMGASQEGSLNTSNLLELTALSESLQIRVTECVAKRRELTQENEILSVNSRGIELSLREASLALKAAITEEIGPVIALSTVEGASCGITTMLGSFEVLTHLTPTLTPTLTLTLTLTPTGYSGSDVHESRVSRP